MTSKVEINSSINSSINPKKEAEEKEEEENKAKNKAKKRSQRCKHCRKKIPMIFVKCACISFAYPINPLTLIIALML